jgi:hypothetical protein
LDVLDRRDLEDKKEADRDEFKLLSGDYKCAVTKLARNLWDTVRSNDEVREIFEQAEPPEVGRPALPLLGCGGGSTPLVR